MNRELKFRAWQSQEKRMYVQGDTVDENRKEFWDIWENKSHISEPMQYTGLKDKNGKEIYEDDIIRIIAGQKPHELSLIFVIIYYMDGFKFLNIRNKHYKKYLNQEIMNTPKSGTYKDWGRCEVIGNIYENPELLETKKDQLSEPKV